MGEGGEIFILEMGTPVVIAQMARDLIRLCGKEPDSEIEIKYVGLRPGEKLYEELITEGEGIVPTGHEKIMVLRGDGREIPDLHERLARLTELADDHQGNGIKQLLLELIPEYKPDQTEAVL
jgi:FlaA1/EpsC-like NDP-sugar epimerase